MPPKRSSTRRPATNNSPSAPTKKPSKLALENNISATQERDINEAFTLFSTASSSASASEPFLPTSSFKPALSALSLLPPSSKTLRSLVNAADPEQTGYISYETFLGICALQYENRDEDAEAREVEEAFRLFLGKRGREEEGEGGARITLGDLKRVARELKEEVEEGVMRDMILEANGGSGVTKGVGMEEFEGVMRRAGVLK